MKPGILADKTVLELGSMVAAPFATHILGQLGAQVIKVEPPGGETTRKLVRGGPSGTYIAYNRGKKSICLDLRSVDGQAILRRLVENADIILHNLSPGAARRLNVTYDHCVGLNPKIVYCHIKGYGAGPMSEEIASNPIAEAATGVMYSNRIDGRPSRLGPSYHDQFAGCYAVMSVLAALLDRDGDPARRNIELGLYETGLHIAARDLAAVQLKSQLLGRPEQEPSPEFSIPGYGAYETDDRRWIYLVMLTDEHWRRFCDAVEIARDPELATLRQRRKMRPRVEMIVREAVSRYDYDALAARLLAAGVGHTEVLSADRVLEAPQAKVAGKCSAFSFGPYSFDAPDFPVPSSTGAGPGEASPPLLGEQTQQILQSLGFTDEEVSAFVSRKAALVADTGAELWAAVRKLGPRD